MNARSLARMYACLGNGGALGEVRLLSEARVDELRQCYTDEVDAVIGMPYRRGLGFWLGGGPPNAAVIGPNPGAFGHPGAGGAIGWCDPEAGPRSPP
jgi:CubicO group peptidase (beta-lactamase class C family)